MIVLHATIAILAVVLLIIVLGVDPVISLVIGSLYLGLAGGLGFEGTLTAIIEGFGAIMAEVGLLIGFGVLMGSLLFAMQALQRLVRLLLRALGARRLPYAMAAVMTSLFPSIYVDVQLVLAAPLARSAAPQLGRHGLGLMGGALTAGILVGYVFVIPGLGTISIAGLLDIPLATMLGYGLLIGPLTAVLTVFVYGLLLKRGFWDAEKDEHASESLLEEEALAEEQAEQLGDEHGRGVPPLLVSLLPVLVPLGLIAFGAIAEAAGFSTPLIAFVGNPVFALFLGLLGAYVLARTSLGRHHTDDALSKGLDTTGQILLVTGVGGSLGAVIEGTDLADVLGGLFSADAGAAGRRQHPAGLADRRGAAPRDRLDLGRRDRRRRHHRSDARPARRGAGDHRAGDRRRRAVRAAGQQQLLLDVPDAARRLDARCAQGADLRDRPGVGDRAAPDPRRSSSS